jgi:hypothetical protein
MLKKVVHDQNPKVVVQEPPAHHFSKIRKG